jgi:nucleotide-binding universal stress UspA family protein
MTELAADDSIVVGVDGSEASIPAWPWAIEQAHALHADVVAVQVWESAEPRWVPYAPASARPTAAEQRDRTVQLLATTLRRVYGRQTDSAVRAVVVEGPPARLLVRQARGALLLTFGRATHGQYGRPAIGTVGRACLRNTVVPVVAVPSPDGLSSPLRAVTTSSFTRRGAA